MLVEDNDSYQAKVILPNLLRAMKIQKGNNILDIACGQGFFTREFAKAGGITTGTDISKSMVELAKKNSPLEIKYFYAPADSMPFVKDNSIDIATVILGIQNIENIKGVFDEAHRILKPKGKFFIVLNHPTFRIPKQSDWGFDAKGYVQYRRIDSYMIESKSKIEMHPGQNPLEYTVSFHRPLQTYFKTLGNAGLAVSRLEEWVSHKKSQNGPRRKAEDHARKEIPMFMMMEAVKFTQ